LRNSAQIVQKSRWEDALREKFFRWYLAPISALPEHVLVIGSAPTQRNVELTRQYRAFTQVRRCDLCSILHNMAAARVFTDIAGIQRSRNAYDHAISRAESVDV
jgi:hypothetical protein